MPLLSVVTVVRNDTDGLRRTLSSLATQTVAADEVLVLDGSDDRSAAVEVVDGFRTLPVDVAWEPPSGVYPAMNAALARVRGRYTYYLNAGDELAAPDILERAGSVLRAELPVWAVGRVAFVQPDGRSIAEPEWSYAAERRRLFARGRFPAHQGVMAQTDTLRSLGGFDTSYRVAADYALHLRLATIADPALLPFVLARFAIGGLSTTHWREGLHEFHRARLAAFQPTGAVAALEGLDTARRRVATGAYWALWSPGRPLSGFAARMRS